MNRNILSTALLTIALAGITSAYTKPSGGTLYSSSLPVVKKVIPGNKSKVRLYPNPTTDGNLSIFSTSESDQLHFYVFDLEGTMVHQVVLKEKEKHKIKNLKKGIYVYDVFVNDTSIEQGRIIVK